MSWNDERVELLSKLWLEGRSASQIAAELGLGVTRNAVIGKVHRLGLSGRAKIAAPAATQGRLRPKAPQKAEQDRMPSPLSAQPLVEPEPETETVAAPVATPIADVVIPFSTRVTIMDLRESMCRWPIGDPASAEFRYCGSKSALGPYCMDHARLAFQPTQERRRVERFARIA
ncbi:GcrA family cell cycle regulator [Lichenihabitans psoromatis]|uniref:GcrA family cell cycle regulator n=1 Tax=Lichenihabitans psoromatis TaxID=2528642 RepID=UPI001036DD56|nr:GcrA family cell cycle regulator [Lichenihabitans psoromatis]